MRVRFTRRRMRWVAGAAAAAVAASVIAPLIGSGVASAATVSPTDPFFGFPASYADDTGLRVQPCLAAGMCTVTPPDATKPASVPDNFPDFGTYASASTRIRAGAVDAFYLNSLIFAFSGETPPAVGQQIVFGRVRIRVKGLVPGAQYTITHPLGVITTPADPGGSISTTTDVGCALAPCDFNTALQSPASQHILRWDTGAPAGFLGDGVSEHTIIGSPNATNYFEISGPNAGGLGVNVLRKNAFVVEGQIATTPFARPTAPRSLAAVAGPGGGQISLSWTDPASTGGTISGYTVMRSLDGTTWTTAGTTGAVNSLLDSGLAVHQTASYKVVAFNPAGQGVWSTVVSATTFDLPTAPRLLTSQAGPHAHDITLTWNAPESNGGAPITAFNVYRSRNTNWELVGTAAGAATSFVDTRADENTHYFYAVAAVNAAGEGARTVPAGVTSFARPSVPRDLAGQAGPLAHEITLSWAAPATDGGTPVTGYRVERTTGDAPFAQLGDVLPADATGWPDGTVAERTTYRYRVVAINIVGDGPTTAAITVKSFGKPIAPDGVVAASGSLPNQITVKWNAVTDDGGTPVTAYTLYRRDADNDWTRVAAVDGSFRSYTDTITGLHPAHAYDYALVASNIVGDSPMSTSQGCSAPFPWVDTDLTNSLICG